MLLVCFPTSFRLHADASVLTIRCCSTDLFSARSSSCPFAAKGNFKPVSSSSDRCHCCSVCSYCCRVREAECSRVKSQRPSTFPLLCYSSFPPFLLVLYVRVFMFLVLHSSLLSLFSVSPFGSVSVSVFLACVSLVTTAGLLGDQLMCNHQSIKPD